MWLQQQVLHGRWRRAGIENLLDEGNRRILNWPLAFAVAKHTSRLRRDQGARPRNGGVDRRGAELLFQVLTEREGRSAVAIASNEPFSGWSKTFTDPRLCAAIVVRAIYNGHIIETGTTSYRLTHARTPRPPT